MADFGTPVAQNVDVNPNRGIQTLSGLLGLQKQKIGIQQQEQELAGTTAETQAKTQQMSERAHLTQALSSKTATDTGESLLADDPDPITGKREIDPNKFAAYATRALPLIGANAAQGVLKTTADKVGLASNVLGLNNAVQDKISGIVRSHIGDPNVTPEVIGGEITNALQGVNSPAATGAAQYTTSLLQLLKHAPSQEAKDRMLSQIAMTYDPAAATRLLRAPSYNVAQGKGGAYVAQTNPLAPQPTGRASPNMEQGIAPAIVTLPNSQLGAGGAGTGGPGDLSKPGGGAQPAPPPASKLQPIQRPPPNAPAADQQNYNAQIQQAGQRYTAVKDAANDPMNGVQATRFRNQQILDLIHHTNLLGPGIGWMNTIASRIPGASGDAYQDIEHYTAQNSAAMAKTMGVPGTNLGAETAAAAAGNVQRNAGALKEITQTNDALNTAMDLYNRGLAKVTKNGSDMSRVNAFQSAFGNNLDINAVRWADAHRRKDADEIEMLKKKGNPSDFAAKLKVLKSLSDTGDLP